MTTPFAAWWNALRHEPLSVPLALIALVLVPAVAFGVRHPAVKYTPVEPVSVAPLGEDVPRLSPVRVRFTAAPLERDGSRLVRLEPAMTGDYVWLDDRTLMFQPEYPGYRRGTQYTIHLAAAPEAGVPEARTQQFTSTGALRVVQTIPEDREQGVVAPSPIIVEFSRAVAPLARLADAHRFQSVLVIDPPIEGKGEWVNTAVFRFTPASPLPPNRRYTVKLRADLTSEVDGQLAEPFQWSFETYGPAVDKITPAPGSQFAAPAQPVTLEFNLPMDRGSVQRALSVKDSSGNAAAGSYEWSNDDRKLVFQPSSLGQDRDYVVELLAGAAGRGGGALANPVRSSFRTVGPVHVTGTEPSNNGTMSPYGRISLTFNNPIDEKSFDGRITINGAPLTRLYESEGSRTLYLSSDKRLQASSTFIVRVAAGAKDRYGQPIAPFEWTFTTPSISPSISFVIPGALAQYGSFEAQELYFSAINTSEVTFSLYSLSRSDFERVMRQGYIRSDEYLGTGTPIRTWQETVRTDRDVEHFRVTRLGDRPLAKGLYYVTASAAGSRARPELVFSVADTALVAKDAHDETLVWALDLVTGRPVASVPVRMGGATQTTNADGIARFAQSKRVDYNARRESLIEMDAQGRYGVTSLAWQSHPNVPQEPYARNFVGHLYSDRVIFRPGERVELKGVIRTDDDAAYRVPGADERWSLVIRGPNYQTLVSESVKVNEFGTFAFTYALPAGGGLGEYRVSLEETGSSNYYRSSVASTSFSVVEFRKPEFEVSLVAPTYRVAGDAIPLEVQATYLFGGGVANAPIHWDVTTATYSARPTGLLAGYSFSDIDPYRPAITAAGPRASGDGVTDGLGRMTFSVPSSLTTSTSPQNFTVSASVSDASAQTTATRANVVVFPADVVPGVRPERYVVAADAPLDISVVTTRPDQTILPGRAVTVRVYERDWVTTKELAADGGRYYKSTPVDTLLETLTATTNERGTATVRSTPRNPGSLRIVVEARDDSGRTGIAAASAWVYGSRNARWRYSNDERFDLVADKVAYQVGDVAQVLVPAPYPGAIGLVTIERGKNIRQIVMRFETNTEVLSIPIEEWAVPDIFVSVSLYRPPTGEDRSPRFNVGTIQLPVSTASRQLAVSIRADRDRATPRDTVRYDVKVTDANGRGVRSEVSLALVDKAVLLLAEDRGPTGLRAFWFDRGLGVNTSSSLLRLVNILNDTLRGLLGDGATKGGDGFATDDPRRDFKNTAFWRAQVRTNDNGEATVEIPLPDNVTTWRMQARAVTPDARVGESVHELLTTTTLIARPALPRFVRVGDELSLRVLVQNNATSPTDATVSVAVTGATLRSAEPRRVRVEPGRSAVVDWPASVPPGEKAVVKFAVVADNGFRDAVEMTLPILAAYTPEAVATSGTIADSVMPEGLYLPKDAILEAGSLTVAVRQSLAATLVSELLRFPRLPFEESTPYVIGRLRTLLALGSLDPSGGYTSRVSSELATVLGRASGDGSFRWCGACGSDERLTADALIALGDAKAAGYAVNQDTLNRGAAYLKGVLDRQRDIVAPMDPNRRAHYLYAIVRAGNASQMAGAIRSAWESDRAQLSTSGRAYLLMAMDEAGVRDSAAVSVRSALVASAVRTGTAAHWEEDLPNGRSGETVFATGLAVEALSRVTPVPSILRDGQNWFAHARVYSLYESSRETGQYARAVSVSAAKSGGAPQPNGYDVLLNGASVMSGRLGSGSSSASKAIPLTSLTTGKVNLLLFARDGKPGSTIFYSALFRYQMPSEGAEALNRGFSVTREITPIDAPGTRIRETALGSTVRVKITVAVTSEQRDVAVSDLLPAGLEAINPRLRTTDPVVVQRLQAEQRILNQTSSTYVGPWMRWYYSPWISSNIHDDRIEVQARNLPKGMHEFVYFARATTVGTFHLPPSVATVQGLPDVFGRGDAETFVVKP